MSSRIFGRGWRRRRLRETRSTGWLPLIDTEGDRDRLLAGARRWCRRRITGPSRWDVDYTSIGLGEMDWRWACWTAQRPNKAADWEGCEPFSIPVIMRVIPRKCRELREDIKTSTNLYLGMIFNLMRTIVFYLTYVESLICSPSLPLSRIRRQSAWS